MERNEGKKDFIPYRQESKTLREKKRTFKSGWKDSEAMPFVHLKTIRRTFSIEKRARKKKTNNNNKTKQNKTWKQGNLGKPESKVNFWLIICFCFLFVSGSTIFQLTSGTQLTELTNISSVNIW